MKIAEVSLLPAIAWPLQPSSTSSGRPPPLYPSDYQSLLAWNERQSVVKKHPKVTSDSLFYNGYLNTNLDIFEKHRDSLEISLENKLGFMEA